MPALPKDVRDRLRRWAEGSACRLLVLFGSSASQDAASVTGDVDLAVWFDHLPGPEERLALIGQFQDIVEPRRADVVFLRPDMDPVLRFEAFRVGIPLHEEAPGLFVTEAVRALALYEDALPFRRRLKDSLRPRESPA